MNTTKIWNEHFRNILGVELNAPFTMLNYKYENPYWEHKCFTFAVDVNVRNIIIPSKWSEDVLSYCKRENKDLQYTVCQKIAWYVQFWKNVSFILNDDNIIIIQYKNQWLWQLQKNNIGFVEVKPILTANYSVQTTILYILKCILPIEWIKYTKQYYINWDSFNISQEWFNTINEMERYFQMQY